jgi:predicted RNase H-like HicB family nuclease
VTVAGKPAADVPPGRLPTCSGRPGEGTQDVSGCAAIIEQGETGYGAYAPELPGVGVAGDSLEEVERLIREAVALHVESLRAHGEPALPPSAVAATVITVPAA